MKIIKKLVLLYVLLIPFNIYAFEEIECSTNNLFLDNSCTQCFDGGKVDNNSPIGFFTDKWVNNSNQENVLYKEEQIMPKFIPLNGTTIKLEPQEDSFWEYPAEFENLEKTQDGGYILNPESNVTWIKSKEGYGVLFSNLPSKKEASLLKFDIVSYPIVNGEILRDNSPSHSQCVLFVSNYETNPETTPIKEVIRETPIDPNEMTKVESGPKEFLIFILLTLILSLFILNRKQILFKFKK